MSASVGQRIVLVVAGVVLGLLGAEGLARAWLSLGEVLPVGDVYEASPVPHVGYRLIPNLDRHALGAELRTNSLGYRGPERPTRKRGGTTRIVVLGDSHAFGFGVAYDEGLAAHLESELSQGNRDAVEVLNFAVPGYNADQVRAVFEGIALAFDPDLLVVVPSSNDHEPAQEAGEDGYLRSSAPGSALVELGRSLARRSRLFRFLRLMQRRRAEPESPSTDGPPARWMHPIEPGEVPTWLERSVGRPYRRILEVAAAHEIAVVLAPFASATGYRRMFAEMGGEHGVPVVELLAVLPDVHSWAETRARFGLSWDSHLGAEAHELWARAVREAIDGDGLLAPPTDGPADDAGAPR